MLLKTISAWLISENEVLGKEKPNDELHALLNNSLSEI